MPRAIDEAKQMTAEEYLQFEEQAEIKHEFVDGFVFAMAGASNRHNVISFNFAALLRPALRGRSCQAYMFDMKLAVVDTYYYPDVFVTCDEDDLTTDIKTSACFVIEVLSKSTSDIDRGEKLRNYRKLTSLKAYVLVSQKQKSVEVYRRLDNGTWQHDIIEEGAFELPCIDLTLTLDEVYEDITFSLIKN